MGLQVFTAVFALPGLRDTPEDVAGSINRLIGAELQRRTLPLLRQTGWNFGTAIAEDHGWHAVAPVIDEGKTVNAAFVTSPEDDPLAEDGRAPDDRWRIVISLDVGVFSKTKARRIALLRSLAGDAEAACRALGATDLVWEVGGP